MIYIDRNEVPAPSILESMGRKETERAHKFYARHLSGRRQLRFTGFRAYRHSSVKKALSKLFHGKCAFCESRSGHVRMDIEQFRPTNGVTTELGEHLPDHYYWLVNEWTNLYPVCIDCNSEKEISRKGSRFPLENESNRAAVRAGPVQLAEERPLLLDPCRDDLSEHLLFTEEGTVVSSTRRGRTTITILGLNRESLVGARRAATVKLDSHLQLLEKSVSKKADPGQIEELSEWLRECVGPAHEYAALHRQILVSRGHEELLTELSTHQSTSASTQDVLHRTKAQKQRVEKEFEAFSQVQDDYSLDVEADRKKYYSKSRRIERVEIRNLKSIRRMKLNLGFGSGSSAWTMFLGENGTGKSTVLQALSLALGGAKYFHTLVTELGIEPAEFVRYRCKSGSIKVFLGPKPNELHFHADHVEFVNANGMRAIVRYGKRKPSRAAQKAWGIQVLLLAYGATRLLPRARELAEKQPTGSDYAKTENLFDPFVPLLNARKWLLELPEDRFDYTALALKGLLDLNETATLQREDEDIWLRDHRSRVPLKQLSDGYQSVIALTADILEVVLGLWASPELAEGVVLLDEIGAHMHPTWKMRVVSALREFLPRMQFIASTHDPLCLRGLSNEEVVVMRRDAKGCAVAVTDLPSVEGLRVDQLLTSEYFGLKSTIDPSYQVLFDEYYKLRRKSRLNNKQKQRVHELRQQLDELGMMGRTRRERLMMDAIDGHLARESADLDRLAREKGELRLAASLADILSNLDEA